MRFFRYASMVFSIYSLSACQNESDYESTSHSPTYSYSGAASNNAEIEGIVEAEITSDFKAYRLGEKEILGMPYAKVVNGDNAIFADKDGKFSIASSSSDSSVFVSNISGKYFEVHNFATDDDSHEVSKTPNADNYVGLTHYHLGKSLNGETTVYYFANKLRDFVLEHDDDYPVIADQTGFRLNVSKSCHPIIDPGPAFYSHNTNSIEFCLNYKDYDNPAFGGMILHEYGHHIVESGGSKQGPYGEGMADAIAVLFQDGPEIAFGARNGLDIPLRSADNNCWYGGPGQAICDARPISCDSDYYACGRILSGAIWDSYQNVKATAPDKVDDFITTVFKSILVHNGTSVDPSIVMDFLKIDDDDGMIENGTPLYNQICDGFGGHGLECPDLPSKGLVVVGDDLRCEGPSGSWCVPGQVTYTLYNPESQPLPYSIDTASSTLVGENNKTWVSGTLQAGEKTDVTLYVDPTKMEDWEDGIHTGLIQFIDEKNNTSPIQRAASFHIGIAPIFNASFEEGLGGFTEDGGENPDFWHVSTSCANDEPGHSPGVLYFGNDDTCMYDGANPGCAHMLSPPIVIENPEMAEMRMKYYLMTEQPNRGDDASVSVSVNGGEYVVMAHNSIEPRILYEASEWQELRIVLSDILPETGPVEIRIKLSFCSNRGNSSYFGYAVDDVTVYAQPGNNNASPCTSYCNNPISFNTTGYQSGNLGTDATCYETMNTINSGNCGNFSNYRHLYVNGVEMTCNWQPWQLPAMQNGGYCIYTGGGGESWAVFNTW